MLLHLSFVYPESGESIIKVNVEQRLPKGEKGYFSGASYGGGIKANWNDLRSKISSGVSQLHPDYPGVLVIEPHELGTGKYDIQNALFGDLAINIFDTSKMFRGKDRIFAKNKNKRLSAVIYCKNRLNNSEYIREKIVYHNLYAKTKLPSSIFSGEHVTQFIPKQRDNGEMYYEEDTG